MQTCEVCAENEDELRAIIAEEFEDEEVTIDQIKVLPPNTQANRTNPRSG
jgi:hypothetical protein